MIKVWFDGDNVVTQVIPEWALYSDGFHKKCEWAALTEDEKRTGNTDYACLGAKAWHAGVEWAEAKLKEKNNG